MAPSAGYRDKKLRQRLDEAQQQLEARDEYRQKQAIKDRKNRDREEGVEDLGDLVDFDEEPPEWDDAYVDKKRRSGEPLVYVPIELDESEFLVRMGWTERHVYLRQPAVWVEKQRMIFDFQVKNELLNPLRGLF